jgi:hypothetical protein
LATDLSLNGSFTWAKNPNTDQFNSAFGQINNSANYPRQIQVVLRANF